MQVHRTTFTAGSVTAHALLEYMWYNYTTFAYPLFVLYTAARLHFSAFHCIARKKSETQGEIKESQP